MSYWKLWTLSSRSQIHLEVAVFVAMRIVVIVSLCAVGAFSLPLPLADDSYKAFQMPARILGGKPVEPHSIPYQAAVFSTTADGVTGFCGGALINAQHVLTAAHCTRVQDTAPATITVVLGAHLIYSTNELNRVTVLAETVIVHPQYDAATLRNDLAVIRLVSAIGLTASIAPVKLPESSFFGSSLPGRLVEVSGWGIIADIVDFIVPELRAVTTRVISIDYCNLMYNNELPDSTMCTYGIGTGTCTGDNGSPLTVVIDSEVTLVGIATFTRTECESRIPSIYTDVTTSLSWIKTTAGILDIQT